MNWAGIDIGTTSLCLVIMNGDSGATVKVATKANDAALPSTFDGEYLQDPDRIVTLVQELLEDCLEEWGRVEALGISCQMHGILYVDRAGKAVSPLYTWQDSRGDLLMEPEQGGAAMRTYTSYMRELTGHTLASGYGLVTHFYNLRNGLVPTEAVRLCTIGDYAAIRLSGRTVPVMDVSNAASIGLFDAEKREFDLSALEKCSMDCSMLPSVASDFVIGKTPDGKDVICAIGDNQSSFLGAVSSVEETLLVNIGTGAQVSLFSRDYRSIEGLDTRPFPGEGYLLVGASLGGGKAYELLERFYREVFRTMTGEEPPYLYDWMNRIALSALENRLQLPVVRTQFLGTRDNPNATGSINNLHPGTGSPQQLTAGLLAGIVEELAEFVMLMPNVDGSSLFQVVASGNGVRRNPAMQRLLKERWKYPFRLAEVEEEAAYGAAIHASVGGQSIKRNNSKGELRR